MDVFRGAFAGLVGGLVGGTVQSHLVPRLVPFETSPPEGVEPEEHRTADAQAAHLVWERILDRSIPEERETMAASLAHYAMAAGIGATYGALASRWEGLTTARGAAFGLAVWALGDELASPLLGLAEPPTSYPADTHVYGLASNVEYGMTTEAVRRLLA